MGRKIENIDNRILIAKKVSVSLPDYGKNNENFFFYMSLDNYLSRSRITFDNLKMGKIGKFCPLKFFIYIKHIPMLLYILLKPVKFPII